MKLVTIFAGAALVAMPVYAQTTLTVVTAGDTNMVDYVNDYLAPAFEAQHEGVSVRALGTGPGDAGSQAIVERLTAQQGRDSVDADVIVVHQRMAGELVQAGLLDSYRGDIATGGMVTRDNADNALGVDVAGFVMPMFNSQIAIAYNPAMVTDLPDSYEELVAWAEQNPGRFGYNGITGGMAGVGFVFGWMNAFAPLAEQQAAGDVTAEDQAAWADAFAALKAFNANATLTAGNAGTMDALNRGEIAMGPVWMDMFYAWVADGRLNPEMKLTLLAPGLPGQPMYYAIPDRAANADLARAFIAFATSPEVQADGIVRNFKWFPGIDPAHVQPHLSDEEWSELFADVPPEMLAERGLSMPPADYFRAILEGYEAQVSN